MKENVTIQNEYFERSQSQNKTALDKVVSRKTGFLLAILANILWGSSFLASKFTLIAWKPFTASSLRFGIATIALAAMMKILGKKVEIPKSNTQWLNLVMLATSAFGVLYPLQLSGLKYINSGFSAAIMLTSPIIVLILDKFILGHKLNVKKWVALFFGFCGGSTLIFSSTGINVTLSSDLAFGSLLTLASSFFLALSVILTKRCSRDFSSATITLWTMGIGFIELTLAAYLIEGNLFLSSVQDVSLLSWASLFFLALVCSAFCFFIWNFALANSSPQDIASSMHIKTPTAVLIGIVIANEPVTLEIIIGTVLVMFGVWLSQTKAVK